MRTVPIEGRVDDDVLVDVWGSGSRWVAVGVGGFIMRSIDGTRTWERVEGQVDWPIFSLWGVAGSRSTVVAGGDNTVLRTRWP